MHHESRTIPKYSSLHRSPTVLAGPQPAGRAQPKMACAAWKQYAKRLSDHTEIVHLYKNLSDNFLQSKPACSVYVKYVLKKEEICIHYWRWLKKTFRTDHHWKLCSALSVYKLSMVIYKAFQKVSNSET